MFWGPLYICPPTESLRLALYPYQHWVVSDVWLLYSGKRRLFQKQTRTKRRTCPPFPQILGRSGAPEAAYKTIPPPRASKPPGLETSPGNERGTVRGRDTGLCVMGTWGLFPQMVTCCCWSELETSLTFSLSVSLPPPPLFFLSPEIQTLDLFILCKVFPRRCLCKCQTTDVLTQGFLFSWLESKPLPVTLSGVRAPCIRTLKNKKWEP